LQALTVHRQLLPSLSEHTAYAVDDLSFISNLAPDFNRAMQQFGIDSCDFGNFGVQVCWFLS